MLKRYSVILLGLIMLLVFPAPASADTLSLAGSDIEYDLFFHDDTDGDGYLDKKSYYLLGELSLTAWDVNGDGSDDLWFRYQDDYLTEEISDRDFDGVPDEFLAVDRDENYTPAVSGQVKTRLYIVMGIIAALILVGLIIELSRKRKGKAAPSHLLLILLLAVFILTSLTPPSSLLLAADIYDQDGTVNKAVFDQDWKKYSDIDDRIPFNSRSYAAQQYDAALNQIAANQMTLFILKQEMEIDRLQRVQLREYKQALVQNIKTNLVKALIRLSYVTYSTIDTGKGAAQSYNKLFSSSVSGIEKISSGLKVISSLQPPSNSPASIRSAGESVGKAGILEYLDTLGDPKKAGKAMFDEAVKQTQSLAGLSPDLTPEEIGILKEQHLKNRGIDKVLEESYRLNRDRRIQIQELEREQAALQKDLSRWEKEEKQRVWDELSANHPDNAGSSDPVQTSTGSNQADNTIYYDTTAVGSIINERPIPEEKIIENRMTFYYPSQGGPLNGDSHTEVMIDCHDHNEKLVIDMDFEGSYDPATGQMTGDVNMSVAVTYFYSYGTKNQYETDTAEWHAQVSGNTIEGRIEESHQFQFGGPFKLTVKR